MSNPRIAVIFRTHFWDAFCQRQFRRLERMAEGTDVFILVDETNGLVSNISHSRIVSVTQSGLLAMGLAAAGDGALLWFNGDYPLYRFIELNPNYDYYMQLEYDVVINRPVVSLIHEMAARQADFIGLTKGEVVPSWFWLDSMLDFYEQAAVRHQLICLCAFSRPALLHLWSERLRQSVVYHDQKVGRWPFCEGFIPTELGRAGYIIAELSDFGSTHAYDHWPPFLESELTSLQGETFVHPVLDQVRYVASLHKYRIGLAGYLNLNSQFHRKLRRLPARAYLGAFTRSFLFKARRSLAGIYCVLRPVSRPPI